MLTAVGLTLALSLCLALSPVAVTTALIMLPTDGRPNRAPAFLLGWILAILLVALAVLLAPGLESPVGTPTVPSGYLRLVLGIAMLAFGVWQWKLRPPPGTEPKTSPFLKNLTRIGFWRAVFIGTVLLAANPIKLVLVVAAANIIDTSMLNIAAQTLLLILFAIGASSTIAVPVIGYWFFQDRAKRLLGLSRDWLLSHSNLIATALLFVFGVLLLVSGVQISLHS
jgi:hypothetical protein